jgi:hypothetical protein
MWEDTVHLDLAGVAVGHGVFDDDPEGVRLRVDVGTAATASGLQTPMAPISSLLGLLGD